MHCPEILPKKSGKLGQQIKFPKENTKRSVQPLNFTQTRFAWCAYPNKQHFFSIWELKGNLSNNFPNWGRKICMKLETSQFSGREI